MTGETNPYDAVVASMPAPGTNPYDAVLADLASSNAATASVFAAQGSNPDVTARALKVSAGLGLPIEVVERNLPDFEGLEKLNRYDAVLRNAPTMLKRWMVEPVNARLVGDDLPALAGTASLWRGLADAGRSAASGLVGFAGSALAGAGEAYDVAARMAGRLAGAAGVPSTGITLPWYLDPAQILKRPGQSIKAFADDIAAPPERKNLVDQVAEGVGQIGGQLATLMATGGAGGLVMLFGQGVDQMADDVEKSGKAGTVAGDAALAAGGMVTAIAEKLGLDLLVRRLPPAIRNKLARAVVDLAAAGGIEAAEEAVEQLGQNALSNYYLETHKNLLDGALDSALPAGGAAAFVRALLVGGGRLRKRQLPNVEQPAADAAALDHVLATVRSTGMARRSSEKLAELLATMGDGGNVYVPAAAVRKYLQSLDPQDARQQVRALGIERQIEQAMATGGDVVIPLHQYVAHAPETMSAAWRDDLRLRAEGLSINDARKVEEGAAELAAIVASGLEASARGSAAGDGAVAAAERELQQAGEASERARRLAPLHVAADQAIAEAQAEVHARAMPALDVAASMTEAEHQAYVESVAHSREIARHAVLAAAMGDIQRRRTPQWKTEAVALRQEIQRAIDGQPDIRALRYLRDGTLPDSLANLRGRPRLRLSREALVEEHGDPTIADSLPRSFERLVTDMGGVRPGEIAGLLGFPDGRSMIDALTALANEEAALRRSGDRRSARAKRIDDAVDRAMLERHGPALFDGSIEREAQSALHNDARANVLAAEVRVLARRAGKVATSYKEARDWARRVFREEPIEKIGDLGLLTRAEARAAFASIEALAKGDIDGALQHKLEQMNAHALWREAREANRRAEVARRKMERRAASRMMDVASDSAVEGDAPAPSSAGSSESGPGVWRTVKEWMEPPAAAYQRQITGERGKAYVVKEVKFDGFSDGTLLEVKGPGYVRFLENGEFSEDFEAREKLLKQARNQSRVANGVPIAWHFAESSVAEAMRILLRQEMVVGIAVVHTAVARKSIGP